MKLVAAFLACVYGAIVHAHSSSDAYLTLELASRAGETVIEGQWDIALRDLHFVLALDDDGDGALTWGEVRRHRDDIASYAYARLAATAGNAACAIERGKQLVSTRADGAYAALFFRVVCKGARRDVTLDYRLLFDVDPTHRGIVVVRNGNATATSLMSPANPRIGLLRR